MTSKHNVEAWMTHSPYTLGRNDTVDRAMELFREHGIRHLPIVDDGELVGLLSERDVLVASRFATTRGVKIEVVMLAEPFVVAPSTSLFAVARTMELQRYGAAVVVGGGRVVGLFTAVDALRALMDGAGADNPDQTGETRAVERKVAPRATMHAAVVEAFGAPLVLREQAIPSPSPGEILIKTEACGVCHTDLHASRGDWPVRPSLPFIPGHEAIGRVVALGSAVRGVKEGDRVGVPWLYSACGHCEHCLAAWETVCAEAKFGGYTQNGGFAEYVLANPDYVARIPDGLVPADAAPIICAGVTTYKGIKETGARAGEWIVISGAGGLGHLAIQYAKAMGLLVCAVDIDDGKLAHAKRVGADLTVNARAKDSVASLRKETGGGAHGVLITAPSLGAFKQGVEMTRKRGTCVLVGLPPGEFPLPLFDVVANCITVRGSFVGTRADMAEALAFAASGKVKADVELAPLSAINDVLGRLQNGTVASRVVLDFVGH